MNYYNENDKFASAWLKELIKSNLISNGEVDDRSIEDVRPGDLRGYTQCHFFAGIGVWSYALRGAKFPDTRKVWTGSCPCQPFSAAGKRKGTADERHLWPAWFHLISQCKPDLIFGEQVATALAWFDIVSSDLENTGYTVGAADTCAAGFGAPHIRQRLYFVADSESQFHGSRNAGETGRFESSNRRELGHAESSERGLSILSGQSQQNSVESNGSSKTRVAQGDADTERPQRLILGGDGSSERTFGTPSLVNGFWRDADWLYCRDEKYRPVEPGTFPLAHGVKNRVGKLRGYGNALCAPQAEAFISSYLESI